MLYIIIIPARDPKQSFLEHDTNRRQGQNPWSPLVPLGPPCSTLVPLGPRWSPLGSPSVPLGPPWSPLVPLGPPLVALGPHPPNYPVSIDNLPHLPIARAPEIPCLSVLAAPENDPAWRGRFRNECTSMQIQSGFPPTNQRRESPWHFPMQPCRNQGQQNSLKFD